MKRSIYSLIGLAVLSASCSTFTDKEQHSLPQEAVTATIGVETRTMIGDKNGNAYKVVWNSGDQIIISTGISSKDKAVYTTSDHGTLPHPSTRKTRRQIFPMGPSPAIL